MLRSLLPDALGVRGVLWIKMKQQIKCVIKPHRWPDQCGNFQIRYTIELLEYPFIKREFESLEELMAFKRGLNGK